MINNLRLYNEYVNLNLMENKKFSLPWVPGLRKPKFVFYKIRFSIPRSIPVTYIYLIIYLSILYIYSGGVYDLVEKPFARGADSQGNPVLVWPDQDRQFLIEGIVAGIIMFMGAAGLFLISQATTDPHNPGRASAFQTMGAMLLILAFILLQSMYNIKTG